MTRVLILTASYGSGHNEAARCLAQALARRGAEPIVVDHFHALVHPLFDRASRALYTAMLRRAPWLWAAGYAVGDRLSSDSWLTFGASRLGASALARLLARIDPQAVISVHATPAVAMAALTQADSGSPPHTTVVTDFVAHSQWIASGIDAYCVADEEVRHELVARGIPPGRVAVTGVPVRSEFGDRSDPVTARRALGLRESVPVVLAMAGSTGSVGRLPDVTRALAAARRPLQGIVVAGRDTALAERLRRMAAGTPVRVLGYVNDVHRLLAAADLLVTKAGGMTLAEAMATETPLLLYGSLPGQERRNERFASRAGIALVARQARDLRLLLDRALGDADLLEALRRRMRARRKPEAAQVIADAVLRTARVRA